VGGRLRKRGRSPATVLLLFAPLALAGCFTTERIDSLVENGRPVPVRFRHAVVATDAGGEPIPDAVVYVQNDEDPIVEVAWTDARGAAVVAEEYADSTIRVETTRLLGIPLGRRHEIRYPTFEMLVARAGYRPFYAAFAGESLRPRAGTPLPEPGSPLVVERDAPRPVTLAAAAAPGHPGRRAAALFETPRVRTVKLGVRGPVNGGRFLRVGSGPGEAPLSCAAQAFRGKAGEEVLLVATVAGAKRRFYEAVTALAETCDDVARGAVEAGPVAEGSLTSSGEARRRAAVAFAAKAEAAPPVDAGGLLARALAAGAQRRRIAVVAPVATVRAVARTLEDRGYRRISETWIEAW
jgi:hypothetical protein